MMVENESIKTLLEKEKGFYLHRSKHEVIAKLMNLKEIKMAYEPDTIQFIQAWAEWIMTARIYTAVKKTKFEVKK
jgi:hypothetical protein